jgi:energy-converting hydrogenase A subunit R
MNDKFYVTDCEGPLSINDNAYEISDYFIPEGGDFFSILSNYDDMLVERNTEGYMAGSTLKLILPFFKAYGLTENDLIQFSEDNINMVDGAYKMIKYVQQIMPFYIVSTSYNQYIKALCDKTGFIYENTYSTQLNLDEYPLDIEEQELLLSIRENILFDNSFENIDNIFTNTISNMKINDLINSVTPVGGVGKRNSILDIIEKNNYEPYNLMYSGDSITDCEALEYAKENQGVSISFNGNIHSIKSASISITSTNNIILALMADIFNNKSTEGVYDFISSYNEDPLESIINYSGNDALTQELLLNKASIDLITEDNIEELNEKSKIVRNKVRGQKIGNLG